MDIEIVEVLYRSSQGRTQPYVCRGSDGETYFVKGRSATRQGLVAEWLCANLAQSFGLPVAPFTIAVVPDVMMESDPNGWLADLGAGPVFASRRVNAVDFTEAHRHHVAESSCEDVAVFDWWVRNEDRTLTPQGGNPNVLWDPHRLSLVVIDHNLAFDPDFSSESYFRTHVFAESANRVFSDFVARKTYTDRLAEAMGAWKDACDMIPEPWKFIDRELTIKASWSLSSIESMLNRIRDETFWNPVQ